MPGFGDSAFIVILALLLFGPKKLPVLARQLGKLMADFRRASNEFRSQMEEELRIAEQSDRQKQVATLEASTSATTSATSDSNTGTSELYAPPPEPNFATPTGLTESTEITGRGDSPTEYAADTQHDYLADQMHGSTPEPVIPAGVEAAPAPTATPDPAPTPTPAPVPIATSGDLSILPPDTGLPIARAATHDSHNGDFPAHEDQLETEAVHTLHD